ncbi:RagB/SusD family nutrient uptake outer membrane protein [Bacteroidota bacterium]
MKKIIKYLILITLPVLVSCDNWLELVPPNGLVQDEYWKNKEDIKASLMGAYDQLAKMDEELFLYGEIRGGMIAEDNPSDDIRDILKGNIYPDNYLCDWSGFYKIINYCNMVLYYNPIIFELDPTYSEYQMQGIESEALFLRSLSYFYLVRIFNEVPLVLEPTSSDNAELYHPKSEEQVILDTIKVNLIHASKFISDDHGSLENNLGRASKNGIHALLADISLWNFEYEECLSYIEKIEESTIGLVSNSDWFTNYYPGNTLESIFELQYNDLNSQGNSLYSSTYTQDNYLVSTSAIELLDSEPPVNENTRDGSFSPTSLKIWKYCGTLGDGKSVRSGSLRASANWIFYRYADILLMKAEALSQLNDFDQAIDYVNMVRERANVEQKSAPQSVNAFEDLIIEERAKELAFEGKRWFDILRMGRRNNFSRKDKLIEIVTQNAPSNQRLVLRSKLKDSMGWYFPIMDTEIERNKNLEQNPYYEGY